MKTYTIPRTGDAPLKFAGRVISESGDQTNDATRWHEITIYETDGEFVAHVQFRTRWDNESDASSAFHGDPREVVAWLKSYDPLSRFVGPPADHPKRKLIESQITQQYEQAVSAVLSDDRFAETPGRADDYAALDRECLLDFVRVQLAAFPLTRNEACAICDANNGALLMPPHCWFGIAANVEDSGRLNNADAKWDVDHRALAGRIAATDRGTQFALSIAIAEFWRRCELPTDEALTLSGFTIREQLPR